MNEVILIGKVISNVEFNFLKESKHVSICLFELKILDGAIVKIKAYDEIADFCYRRMKLDSEIFINGKIRTCGVIEVKKIKDLS